MTDNRTHTIYVGPGGSEYSHYEGRLLVTPEQGTEILNDQEVQDLSAKEKFEALVKKYNAKPVEEHYTFGNETTLRTWHANGHIETESNTAVVECVVLNALNKWHQNGHVALRKTTEDGQLSDFDEGYPAHMEWNAQGQLTLAAYQDGRKISDREGLNALNKKLMQTAYGRAPIPIPV